jgi:GNAT superfamily N-acetyltransferase
MDFDDLVDEGVLLRRDDAFLGGYSREQIRYRLETGQWTRVRKGLYVAVAAVADGAARDALLVTLRAAQNRVPGAVASHHTAAAVHGLPVFGRTEHVTMTRDAAPGRTPVDLPDIRVLRAALPPADVVEVEGIAVTSLARTVCDRARVASFRAGLVTADAALRRGVPREAMLAVLERCRRWPGKRRAVEVVLFADPRAESPLESVSRVFFRDHGLPMPVPQSVITGPARGFVARVDFLWPDHRVVGEADGDVKYTDAFELDPDQPLRPLLLEKRRQESIENLDYVVVRWDYAGVLGRAAETEARIRRAFSRGARLHPPTSPS